MQPTISMQQVLKGGEFVIKTSLAHEIFTPEDLTEEQRMIRQMVKDFVQAEALEKGGHLEHQVELLTKAAELGLLGAHIPEAYQGLQMDNNTNTVITEAIGLCGNSFTTSFAAHIGIGMLPILYFGTEEQKQKYLPRAVNGEFFASYCLTEPGSGSDALAAKTSAVLSEDGQYYLLNGQKMWITNAGFADIFIVFAKIDGDKFTGFIVERDAEGLTLGAEEKKLGIKGSSTRQIFFENCKVPAGNLLGEIGKGHLIAFNILNIGRFKLGVLTIGGSISALNAAIRYANERIQFKVPIASFGAIKYKLAEQAIRIFSLSSSCYRISDMMQQRTHALMATAGMAYSDALLEAAEEYAIECAMMKVYGSETASYCVDETLQIHGGMGFSEEYKIAQAYRDVRINRIYEGTNEINRLLVVNMFFKKALSGKLDIVSPAWEVQKELAQMPNFEALEGAYAAEKKTVKDLKKVFLMVAGAAAKWQMDGKLNLREEQEILMNVSDIAIEIFNIESVLLRVEKLSGNKTASEMEVYDAILQVALQDVSDRIAKYAKDALASFAEGDVLNIFMMGLKRFAKYGPVNVKQARRIIAKKLIQAGAYEL